MGGKGYKVLSTVAEEMGEERESEIWRPLQIGSFGVLFAPSQRNNYILYRSICPTHPVGLQETPGASSWVGQDALRCATHVERRPVQELCSGSTNYHRNPHLVWPSLGLIRVNTPRVLPVVKTISPAAFSPSPEPSPPATTKDPI